jgi:hypothetical protein
MSVYAFWRLVWRPMVGVWAVLFVGGVGLVPLLDAPGGPWSVLRGQNEIALRAAQMSSFLLPAFTGFIAGRITKELQHCSFAWTLPGLRTKLALGIVPLAFLTTLPGTSAWLSAGDPGMAAASFAMGLFWFSMAGVILEPIPTALVSRTLLVCMVLALFRLQHLNAMIRQWPWLFFVLGLAGAALFFYRDFSATVARARLFLPTMPLGTGGEREWMLERMTRQPVTRRRWSIVPIGTGLKNWLKASEYENFGRYRAGWLGWAAAFSLLALVVTIFENDQNASLGAEIAWIAAAYHVVGSPFLKKRLLHPLSRIQRARVAWWGSLLSNVGACVLALIVLWAGHRIWQQLPDPPGSAKNAIVFLQPLLFVFAFAPLLQWLQIRYLHSEQNDGGSFRGLMIFFAAMFGYMGLVWAGSSIPAGGLAIAAAAGTALLMQFLYVRMLHRYFTTGDLV